MDFGRTKRDNSGGEASEIDETSVRLRDLGRLDGLKPPRRAEKALTVRRAVP
jgi:hypothetical protein